MKGDILSAFSSTSRRVLGGAALSAVLLGAGTGIAFAGDIDNTGSGSPVFGDQSNNAVAGNGAAGGAGGVGTGGTGGGTTGSADAAGGNGGAGGAGGSIGANSPTQNANNQQANNATDQTSTSTGTAAGTDAATGGQTVTNDTSFGGVNQQGANSTAGILGGVNQQGANSTAGAKSDCSTSYHESKGYKPEHKPAHEVSHESSSDSTPVGAADTGDGSYVDAASASGLGDEIALGGAISAAALLGAYGISIARRRSAAHSA